MIVDQWDLGKEDRGLAETLHIGLQEVMDPELGMNIVQLGLVRNVKIKDDEALVTMILTTPFCPYAPQLLEECRSRTEEVLGIPTKIEMGREFWDRSMMEDDAIDWGLYKLISKSRLSHVINNRNTSPLPIIEDGVFYK